MGAVKTRAGSPTISDNSTASPSYNGDLSSLFRSAGLPAAKGPQHVGMGKESIAFVAKNRTVHRASHIAPRGHFTSGNLNLIAMAICVFNRRAVDHAIQTGPQCCAHAHRARFAGGIKCVTGQRKLSKSLRCQPNCPYLSVCARVKFLPDCIQRAKQQLAGFRVDDGSAEWSRTLGAQRSRRESRKLSHPLQVEDRVRTAREFRSPAVPRRKSCSHTRN